MERVCILTERCFAEKIQRESDSDTLFRATMVMLQLRKYVRANATMAILSRVLQSLAKNGSWKAASVSRKVRVLEYFLRIFKPQITSIFDGRLHIDFYAHILINVAREDVEDIKDTYELLLE